MFWYNQFSILFGYFCSIIKSNISGFKKKKRGGNGGGESSAQFIDFICLHKSLK